MFDWKLILEGQDRSAAVMLLRLQGSPSMSCVSEFCRGRLMHVEARVDLWIVRSAVNTGSLQLKSTRMKSTLVWF